MPKNEAIAIPSDPNDPEDFDVTFDMLDEACRARAIRRARHATGLSQVEFARRLLIPVGTLRDWEQNRVTAPPYAAAYATLAAKHLDEIAPSAP